MSVLRDRLREIVRPKPDTPPPSAVESGFSRTPADLETTLGGQWMPGRQSFVIERRIPPDAMHGRLSVGTLAEQLSRGVKELLLLAPRTSPASPLFFFDLETTGLSGGAGTYAFLVGYACVADDGAFVTRQHLLVDHGAEASMLDVVARELAAAGSLVSFNGKSFDQPVLDTRYLLHRLDWPGRRLPHVDVLHPARRFWGGSSGECSLVRLEERILGRSRTGDVPGFEIPSRYFQFLRTGDARPLSAVFEHNRQDLLSLAGFTGRLVQLIADGPGGTADPDEALALGHVYERAGLDARAREAFQHAIQASGGSGDTGIDARRRLAAALRRCRRHEEAAACWRELLEIPRCPRHVAREANEALAIYHEHRVRDLDAAKTFALQSLEGGENRTWRDGVRHRLARLDRKITASGRLRFPSSSALP